MDIFVLLGDSSCFLVDFTWNTEIFCRWWWVSLATCLGEVLIELLSLMIIFFSSFCRVTWSSDRTTVRSVPPSWLVQHCKWAAALWGIFLKFNGEPMRYKDINTWKFSFLLVSVYFCSRCRMRLKWMWEMSMVWKRSLMVCDQCRKSLKKTLPIR